MSFARDILVRGKGNLVRIDGRFDVIRGIISPKSDGKPTPLLLQRHAGARVDRCVVTVAHQGGGGRLGRHPTWPNKRAENVMIEHGRTKTIQSMGNLCDGWNKMRPGPTWHTPLAPTYRFESAVIFDGAAADEFSWN